MSGALAIAAALLGAATSTAAQDAEAVILVIDDEDPWPTQTSSATDVLVIDDAPFEAAPTFEVRARASVRADVRVGLDTAFDRAEEQVGELAFDAELVLEVDLLESLRVYAAPRLVWLGGLDRDGGDREILVTQVPEAFVGWAQGPLAVRAGYLVFDWGQSEIVGPSDVLNPPDLRRAQTGIGDTLKIPVPSAEVVATFGPLTVRGVVQPVFVPGRFFLAGWDLSALQGGLLPGGPELADQAVLEPAFLDGIGDLALQTERPRDRPDNATLGLRTELAFDDVQVAATLVHGWNPFPSVTVDPALVALGGAWAEAQRNGENLSFDDPELAGALLDLQRAVEAGAPVFKGKFERRTVVGADLSWALDPIILKLDVAYTTRQVSYTRVGQARASPAVTGVLGAEYYRGEDLQVWVEAFFQHILEIVGTDPLAYVELDAAPQPAGRGATWFGAGAFARYQLLEGDLAFEIGALLTSRLDLALLPRMTYALTDHHRVYLGGMVVEGQGDGVGGAYSHLDQVYAGYRFSY